MKDPIIHVVENERELQCMMEFVGDTYDTDLHTIDGEVYDSYLGTTRNTVYKTSNLVHVRVQLEENRGCVGVSDPEYRQTIVMLGKGVKGRDMVREYCDHYISSMRNEYKYLITTVQDDNLVDTTNIYVPVENLTDTHGESIMISLNTIQSVLTIPKEIPHIVIRRRVEGNKDKKFISAEAHEVQNGKELYSVAFTGFPYQRCTTDFAPESMDRFGIITYLNAAFKKPTCTEWVDVTSGFRL